MKRLFLLTVIFLPSYVLSQAITEQADTKNNLIFQNSRIERHPDRKYIDIALSNTLFPCALSIPLMHSDDWGNRKLGTFLLFYGSAIGPSMGDFYRNDYSRVVDGLKIRYIGFAAWFSGVMTQHFTRVRHLGEGKKQSGYFGWKAGQAIKYGGIAVYCYGVFWSLKETYDLSYPAAKAHDHGFLFFPQYDPENNVYGIQMNVTFK